MCTMCVSRWALYTYVYACVACVLCAHVCSTCMCVPSVCALPGHVQLRALALKCSTQVLAEACHFLSRKLKFKQCLIEILATYLPVLMLDNTVAFSFSFFNNYVANT